MKTDLFGELQIIEDQNAELRREITDIAESALTEQASLSLEVIKLKTDLAAKDKEIAVLTLALNKAVHTMCIMSAFKGIDSEYFIAQARKEIEEKE